MTRILITFISGFILCLILVIAVPSFGDRVTSIRNITPPDEESPVVQSEMPTGRYIGDPGWIEFEEGILNFHDGEEVTTTPYSVTPDMKYIVIYDTKAEGATDVWEFKYSEKFDCLSLDGIVFCK